MNVKRRLAPLLGLVVVVASLGTPKQAHAAGILQVPADYSTIAAALAASTAGDTVVVAPGTYTENVHVPSGVTLNGSGGPAVTTIDGNQSGIVAVVDVDATMHGFTLQNGGEANADVGGAKVYGTLDGNVITNNFGCFHASAVWLLGGTLSNNSFHDNVAGCQSDVVDGVGTIVGNDFDEGYPQIMTLNGESPTIERNIFRGGAWGIRMFNDSKPVIRNNLFLAAERGALEWTVPSGGAGPTIVNNTIVALAGFGPLVVADGFDSSTTFANNILIGNHDTTLIDCPDLYDHQPPIIEANDVWRPGGGGLTGLCSGVLGTNGNVSVDPKVESAATGDYHLRADSPLIDAGINGISMGPDIDGDARPFDGDEDGTATVDIGFDESLDPLAVAPGDLTFGGVPLARTSTLDVTLTNLGSSAVSLATVTLTGAGAGDFTTTGQTCTGASIAVGQSCTIPVGFTPSSLAERDATLTVTGTGAAGTHIVPLTGHGVEPIGISPLSFTFPDVTVGDPGASASITVTNDGGAPATISNINVTGNTTDVTIGAETCTAAPLPQDGTCSVPFSWRPRDSGDRAASIAITGPAPFGTRSVSLSGHAWAPPSGVSWGSTYAAGPAHTWNGGSALARTVKSGSQRLHLLYSTDRVGGKWVTDGGPKVGLYYIRSTSGVTWSAPKRLNPTTEHATVSGLAAGGSKVYAMWVSQTKYVHYSRTAKRILYVRVNTDHGSSTSWRTRIRLSSSTGRVDYPAIAASGNSDVHLAYTNANTGTVYVRSSRDGGRTWPSKAMGTTSIALTDGRTGFPTIAVSGSTVAVCWLSDTFGTVRCRVSTTRGVSWGSTVTIGSGATGYFSVAVRGSRIAVAWPTDTGIVVRQRLSGVWQAARSLATVFHYHPYGVNVLLQDPNRVRVTWAEGGQGDNDFTYVFAAESANGGATYFASDTPGNSGSSHWRNDWASVIWPSASTRYVVWNGWTAGTSSYRLFLIRGVGAPVGPSFASSIWQPTSTGPTIRVPSVFGPVDGPASVVEDGKRSNAPGD